MDIRFIFTAGQQTPAGELVRAFHNRPQIFGAFLLPWEQSGYANNGGEHSLTFYASPGRMADILFKMAQVLPQHATALAEKEAMVMATLEKSKPGYVNHYNSVANQLIEEHVKDVPLVKRWFVRAMNGEIDVHTRMVTNAYSDYLKSTTDSFAIWKSYTQAEYTKLVEGMLKHI